MTTRQFKIILYIVLVVSILAIELAFRLFDFCEYDTAINWTIKYFSLPFSIASIPSSYFIYSKLFRQSEAKETISKLRKQLQTIVRILILISGVNTFLFCIALSVLILTNTYIGNNRSIKLNAKIIDYYALKSKFGTWHFIKIKDQQLDRIIELKVQKPYQVGQIFRKTMNIGQWGLLYSRK